MLRRFLFLALLAALFCLTGCAPAAPPTPTTAPSRTPSPSPSPLPSATPTPTLTPTPSPTPTATALPEEHYITRISGHKQYFPLGCEAAAAKDWANYFGYDFSEFEFQLKLPLSDNPEFGFVGDVRAPWGQVPPYGYGVHAGPVADLLNAYGIPARAYKGYTMEQIKVKLAEDKPIIAWVIGNVEGGVPYEYTDKAGNKVVVAAFEHVIILTGYNADRLRYMNNGKFYEVPYEVFLNSFAVLGNMVVVDE